jgi:STE24 endopeptidase
MAFDLVLICSILLTAKWLTQMVLERMNQMHVRAHAAAVPQAFAGTVSPETYAKSIAYTLAKSRLEMVNLTWSAVLLALLLFSGALPWFFLVFQHAAGSSVWAGAAFLLTVGLALTVVDWPLEWYAQFHLEERFGFNTSTATTWWLDRAKGLLLGLVLGYPLLLLILKLAGNLGNLWWLWAWACLAVFQFVLM